MNLKTYRGKSMADALDQVKKDLGKSAVILHTRAYRVGAVLGVGGHQEYEITASDQAVAQRDQERQATPDLVAASVAEAPVEREFVPEAFSRLGAKAVFASSPAREDPQRLVEVKPANPKPSGVAPLSTRVEFAPTDENAMQQLRGELGSIRQMVGQLLGTSRRTAIAGSIAGEALSVAGLADPLSGLYLRLQDAGVDIEHIERIAGRVRDELSPAELEDAEVVRSSVVRHLAAMLPVVGSVGRSTTAGHPLTVALVGPTGVGKTTTIAKLAALYKLRYGLQVGLVTADTYRIAAVEQLRTYANIIGLSIKVALTAQDVEEACASLRDCDVVLVDTAGRSQHDQTRLDELGEFVLAAKPDEIHLVLAAGSAPGVLQSTACRFGCLKPDRLLITKLDEAVTFGSIANLAARISLPVSYVTTGQEVPEHIELAQGERLARLVLSGSLRV